MARELDQSLGILDRIPPRDKDIITLGAVFFYGKYVRRQGLSEGFKLEIPPVDFDDCRSVLTAAHSLHRQEHADIDGDAVRSVSDILSNHPRRQDLFGHLTDRDIRTICYELDEKFENDEFCAWCEMRSNYDDVEPEEFAINSAGTMLWLGGKRSNISWFRDMQLWRDREAIIKVILKEKLSRMFTRRLSSGEDGRGLTSLRLLLRGDDR